MPVAGQPSDAGLALPRAIRAAAACVGRIRDCGSPALPESDKSRNQSSWSSPTRRKTWSLCRLLIWFIIYLWISFSVA